MDTDHKQTETHLNKRAYIHKPRHVDRDNNAKTALLHSC